MIRLRLCKLLFCRPKSVGLLACLLAGLGGGLPSEAKPPQLTITEEETPEGNLTIYNMTVTPAAEPVPALKHRLLVMPHETKPGNFVTYYLRSMGENTHKGYLDLLDELFGEDENEPWDTSLQESDMDKLKRFADSFQTFINDHMARATLSRDLDWGVEEEDLRGLETFSFLLPSVQGTRSISRMLALSARYAIAEGRYEDAIEILKMNLKLARSVAEMKFLVADLVAIAEVRIGNKMLAELIAGKDSPNLYWALAEIPSPCIEIRDSMRLEMSAALRMFPALEDAETAERSKEQWNAVYGEIFKSISQSFGYLGVQYSPVAPSSLGVGLGLIGYSAAKDRLVEGGMSRDVVEEMAVGQVMLIDARRQILIVTNECEKSLYVPFQDSRSFEDELDKSLRAAGFSNPGLGLAGMLLPAFDSVRIAALSSEAEIRGLQTVEAVRMHLAETGELPKTINDIKIVPVPLNPFTGQKFVYWLDGDTAVIDLPRSRSGGTYRPMRIKIQVAK